MRRRGVMWFPCMLVMGFVVLILVFLCFLHDPWLESKEKKVASVTKEKAHRVAQIFLEHPSISAVELFGSTMRKGCGRDLDIILVSDVGRVIQWNILENHISRASCHSSGFARLSATRVIFGKQFVKRAEKIIRPASLDIYVCTSEWRDNEPFPFEIRREAQTVRVL